MPEFTEFMHSAYEEMDEHCWETSSEALAERRRSTVSEDTV